MNAMLYGLRCGAHGTATCEAGPCRHAVLPLCNESTERMAGSTGRLAPFGLDILPYNMRTYMHLAASAPGQPAASPSMRLHLVYVVLLYCMLHMVMRWLRSLLHTPMLSPCTMTRLPKHSPCCALPVRCADPTELVSAGRQHLGIPLGDIADHRRLDYQHSVLLCRVNMRTGMGRSHL